MEAYPNAMEGYFKYNLKLWEDGGSRGGFYPWRIEHPFSFRSL